MSLQTFFDGSTPIPTMPKIADMDLSGYNGTITLKLKDISNTVNQLKVNPDTNITDVKDMLKDYARGHTLQLSSAGNILIDGLTVGDYDLGNHSIVYVLFNLHGGGKSTRGFGFRPPTR